MALNSFCRSKGSREKLYGLDSIFTFAFPLMMGMISGVYTSLCVSTSAWVLWSERSKKKN